MDQYSTTLGYTYQSRDLGQRLRSQSGHPLSYCYLEQQIAEVVQRGNAAAVLGTAKLATQAWLSSVVVIVLVTVHTVHVIWKE